MLKSIAKLLGLRFTPRSLSLIILLSFLAIAALSLDVELAAEPGTQTSPRTLIKSAALLITMDPKLGEGPLGTLSNADLLIAGDTIVAVGKQLSDSNATIVDATGTIVLPGFVDLHNHLVQSIIRGGCPDQDLLAWLEECTFPAYQALTPEDVYAAVRLSTLDLIGTGVTTVVDWAGGLKFEVSPQYIRALTESGLRFAYAPTARKEEVEALKQLWNDSIKPNPLATLQVAGTTGMQHVARLSEAVRLAKDWGIKLNVHLLEHIKQRQREPIRSLEESGALGLGGNLIVNHAIHLTDEEIALLARHDMRIAHNPLSNMRLASGIIRMAELHAAGLKIGLGLDGSTNDTSDMFSDMRAAVGLQRVKTLRAAAYPTVTDILRMATLGGAEALDLDHKIGSLTPGKKADLIIINPMAVNFAPRFDWIGQLVFNAQPANVSFVFVNGVALKAHGEFVRMKAPEVVRAAESAAARLRDTLQRNRSPSSSR